MKSKKMYLFLMAMFVAGSLLGSSPATINTVAAEQTDATTSEEGDETPTYVWSEGDTPYCIKYYDVIYGYAVVHEDGTYDMLDQAGMDDALNARSVATGNPPHNDFWGYEIEPQIFQKKVLRIQRESYDSKEEGIVKTAQPVDTYLNIPDGVVWEIFDYEGKTYYTYYTGGMYYSASAQAYRDYENGMRTVYDEPSAGSLGNGDLAITLTLGGSLLPIDGDTSTEESIYIEIESQAGDEYDFLITPPSYYYYVKLEPGTYMVTGAVSQMYPEYALSVEHAEFTVTDTSTCELSLYVYRDQDEIQGQVSTEENVEASVDFQQNGASDNSVSNSSISDNTTEAVTASKNNTLGLRIGLGVLAIALISGIAYFVYKKHR